MMQRQTISNVYVFVVVFNLCMMVSAFLERDYTKTSMYAMFVAGFVAGKYIK